MVNAVLRIGHCRGRSFLGQIILGRAIWLMMSFLSRVIRVQAIRVRVVSDSPSARVCTCRYNTAAHVVNSTYIFLNLINNS